MESQTPSLKASGNDTSLTREQPESDGRITIHDLNDDCLIQIFSKLPAEDRLKIQKVCRRWEAVGRESWRDFKLLSNSKEFWELEFPGVRTIQSDRFEKLLQCSSKSITHISLSNKSFLHIRQVRWFQDTKQELWVEDRVWANLPCHVVRKIISDCINVREIILANLPCHCSKEPHSFCTNWTSELFLPATKLKRLEIMGNKYRNLNGTFVKNLPENSIEVLITQGLVYEEIDDVCDAFNGLRKLSELRLLDCEWSTPRQDTKDEKDVKMISLTNELKILEIPKCPLIDMNAISKLTNLEILNISCNLVTDAVLFTLSANSEKISCLNLSGCSQITDVGVKAICQLPGIEELALDSINSITGQTFKTMPKLRKLSCSHCTKLEDDGIRRLIESCQELQFLDLTYCPNITSQLIVCAENASQYRANGIQLEYIIKHSAPSIVSNTSSSLSDRSDSEGSYDVDSNEYFGYHEDNDDVNDDSESYESSDEDSNRDD